MNQPTEQIIERHAARVLLLDAQDRVLLFHCKDPSAERAFWITPGGGLEDGESHEEAAKRELFEETGLAGVAIGRCVWRRSHTFPWMGRVYRQHERFFLVRIPSHEVDIAMHTDEERVALTTHRWWTAEQIQQASIEYFAPRQLGTRLTDLIEAIPTEPIDVGA